jgi:hypothetical protein
MSNSDPFDPERWHTNTDPTQATGRLPKKERPTRSRRSDRFLKGPVPWSWLKRAMTLPGKALAVGLMLWLQRGMARRRTIPFCLAHAAANGIPEATARRAIQNLEKARLVTIRRKPGRGLEVTILDLSPDEECVENAPSTNETTDVEPAGATGDNDPRPTTRSGHTS